MKVTGDLEKSSVVEQWEWRPDYMGSCGRDGKSGQILLGRCQTRYTYSPSMFRACPRSHSGARIPHSGLSRLSTSLCQTPGPGCSSLPLALLPGSLHAAYQDLVGDSVLPGGCDLPRSRQTSAYEFSLQHLQHAQVLGRRMATYGPHPQPSSLVFTSLGLLAPTVLGSNAAPY